MSWKRSMVVVGVAAALAACGGGSGKGNLSVSAKSSPPAGAAASSGSGTQTSLDLGNGISIDQIKVVVRKLEVEGPSASCATTPPANPPAPGMKDGNGGDDNGGGGGGSDDPPGHDQGDDDEACEIEAGPFLVSLSGADLVSGIHPVFDTSIPTGTFTEISVRIDTINAEKAASAPIESQRADLADMAARNISLEIKGTRNGQPFDLTAAVDFKLKREGSITISSDGSTNLTFDVNPAGWFGPSGATLDPSDPAQAATIVQNILASFRMVHDDNHDGMDDQNDDHGNDGPGHG